MNIKGGCYCGAIRYEFEGDVTATFQCHCRECQFFTGGHASAAYVLPQDKFTFITHQSIEGTYKTYFIGKHLPRSLA